jgi:hypothetical protein
VAYQRGTASCSHAAVLNVATSDLLTEHRCRNNSAIRYFHITPQSIAYMNGTYACRTSNSIAKARYPSPSTFGSSPLATNVATHPQNLQFYPLTLPSPPDVRRTTPSQLSICRWWACCAPLTLQQAAIAISLTWPFGNSSCGTGAIAPLMGSS